MKAKAILDRFYALWLSDRSKERGERIILGISIVSFILHLLIIGLVHLGWLPLDPTNELLKSPIAAIYTPFSFILLYEVYLLIYYLPKSITTYVQKQFEIITLIVIRRLFKDLANLELTSDWFQFKDDIIFTYDIVTSIVLFILVYFFQKHSLSSARYSSSGDKSEGTKTFIRIKKILALILVPLFLSLAIYTLASWSYVSLFETTHSISFKDVNDLFFDEFFTILIIADIFLLLFSFFQTDQFYKVIRNSGFVISTILIRLSFSVDGLINIGLILLAVLFGLVILFIHNKYEEQSRLGT